MGNSNKKFLSIKLLNLLISLDWVPLSMAPFLLFTLLTVLKSPQKHHTKSWGADLIDESSSNKTTFSLKLHAAYTLTTTHELLDLRCWPKTTMKSFPTRWLSKQKASLCYIDNKLPAPSAPSLWIQPNIPLHKEKHLAFEKTLAFFFLVNI